MKGSSDLIIDSGIETLVANENRTGEADLTFKDYFKNNYANLCWYAFSFVRDKDAAEDIVQEVFFNIWKSSKPEKYSEIKQSYLYKSVKNSSLNYIKHKNVINSHVDQEYVENRINGITPENDSIAAELSTEIEKAIDRLPERQREIFILSRKNELTYKEIASLLEISVKTVESQMGSALKTLRKYLSHFFLLF